MNSGSHHATAGHHLRPPENFSGEVSGQHQKSSLLTDLYNLLGHAPPRAAHPTDCLPTPPRDHHHRRTTTAIIIIITPLSFISSPRCQPPPAATASTIIIIPLITTTIEPPHHSLVTIIIPPSSSPRCHHTTNTTSILTTTQPPPSLPRQPPPHRVGLGGSHPNRIESGDVVEVTLWDKMAIEFNTEEFEKIKQPVIFAISSCKANIYGGLTVSGTLALTHYFNLEILVLYRQRLNLNPPLQISKERCSDINAEKNRNIFPLNTLLQQNPDGYRSVRFTCEATITSVITSRDWYYQSCNDCIGKVYDGNGEAYYANHGLQKPPTYRHIFKTLLKDQSATALVTFFTPNADVLTGSSCTELVKKYGVLDPLEFPDEILSLNGRTHIFQIHYNPSSVQGRVDFYFDDILDKPLQIVGPSQSSETSTASTVASLAITKGVSSDTPSIPTPNSETTTKNVKRALFETEYAGESKKKKE
ncbi:nucleic acid-binding, OB-fold protein [Tanacetum coccineum]